MPAAIDTRLQLPPGIDEQDRPLVQQILDGTASPQAITHIIGNLDTTQKGYKEFILKLIEANGLTNEEFGRLIGKRGLLYYAHITFQERPNPLFVLSLNNEGVKTLLSIMDYDEVPLEYKAQLLQRIITFSPSLKPDTFCDPTIRADVVEHKGKIDGLTTRGDHYDRQIKEYNLLIRGLIEEGHLKQEDIDKLLAKDDSVRSSVPTERLFEISTIEAISTAGMIKSRHLWIVDVNKNLGIEVLCDSISDPTSVDKEIEAATARVHSEDHLKKIVEALTAGKEKRSQQYPKTIKCIFSKIDISTQAGREIVERLLKKLPDVFTSKRVTKLLAQLDPKTKWGNEIIKALADAEVLDSNHEKSIREKITGENSFGILTARQLDNATIRPAAAPKSGGNVPGIALTETMDQSPTDSHIPRPTLFRAL